MATTTTNFGWDIPQSTDLVKDGATAIAALGQDIDTALVDLKGGTTGQVLAKASGTDLDFSWVAVDPLTILDAKGDLISATAADTPARVAVGTNGQVLTADSTASTGIKWATPSSGALTLISTTTLSGSTTNVDSVFSSTYDNYLIEVCMDSNTGVGALTMQLRASGTATTTGYYFSVYQFDWGGTPDGVSWGTNGTSARIGTTFNGEPSPVTMTMYNPNRALRTTYQGLSQGGSTGASGSQMFMGGFVSNTTQYDGFSIIGGSQTGKVRVYGLQN